MAPKETLKRSFTALEFTVVQSYLQSEFWFLTFWSLLNISPPPFTTPSFLKINAEHKGKPHCPFAKAFQYHSAQTSIGYIYSKYRCVTPEDAYYKTIRTYC
jgi:hypothetical protein